MNITNDREYLRLSSKNKLMKYRVFIINYLLICVAVIASFLAAYSYVKTDLINAAKDDIKAKVQMTQGFLDYLNTQVSQGRIALPEAQEEARDYILGNKTSLGERDFAKSKMGFSQASYVYILSDDARLIAHPFLEGQSLWNYKDNEGNYVAQDIVDPGRFGKFKQYNWQNENNDKIQVIDYAEYFEPWRWVIGTGEDTRDIYISKLNNLKYILIILALVLAPLGVLFSKLFIITNMKKLQLEEHFYRVNFYDSLTGLPNHTFFNGQMRVKIAEMNKSQKLLGVIIIDIDKFKYINDVMGTETGDLLLKEVSTRLKDGIGRIGMVARQSGDEFMVMVPDMDNANDVVFLANKLLDLIAQPYTIKGQEFFATGGAGISIYPKDGTDMESLIKNANTALTFVKENGSNNYAIFHSDMNAKAYERIEMESRLRKALKNNEFILYYQPLVDLKTGFIIGMESLIRWNHPELGLLSPAKFIGIAEEVGLLISIGEWVMRKACMQNKKWQDQGLPKIRVSVNISPRQFEQDNFVDVVKGVIEETGLEPQYLELEITEDVVRNVEGAISTLKKLKSMGIRISLDDFGTGYSSLSHLKTLPIDTIKIDKSFVKDIDESLKETAITTAVISMGHNLKLTVLAEGVETEAQLSYLKDYNCDAMQGYYFSEPVSPDVFEGYFKVGRHLKECKVVV